MAYDEALAERIRELIGDQRGLAEQKMFGGLAFLIGGNMAVAASGQGGLLVRVDPDESDELSEGGLGIVIIQALADELEIGRPNGGGSRLRFVKRFST